MRPEIRPRRGVEREPAIAERDLQGQGGAHHINLAVGLSVGIFRDIRIQVRCFPRLPQRHPR